MPPPNPTPSHSACYQPRTQHIRAQIRYREPRVVGNRNMNLCSTVAVAITVSSLGCGRATPTLAQSPAPASRTFDRSSLDTTCAPCRDFFQFANGGWLARTEIPGEFPSWGSFDELYEHNLDVLHDLLEAAARDSVAPPASNRGKLGRFYGTCMDSAAAEAAASRPLQPELDRIGAVNAVADVQGEVARLQRSGNTALFSFTSDQDAKHSTEMIAEASQGGLGLPDRDYYTKTDSASEQLKREYVAHMARTLELLGTGVDEARSAAQKVMAIETALAQASMTQVQLRDPNATYHRMTAAELGGLAPRVAWKDYFDQVGAPPVPDLNVQQPDFFRTMSQLLGETPLAAWRWYLRWHLVRAAARWLSSPFAKEDFHFRQVLTGVKQQQPRWRRCVEATDQFLGEALGEAYVERRFSPEAKRRALEMVNNLEAVMRDRLHGLGWMSDATRQQALAKLATYVNKIGYPDRWRDYSALAVERGPFITNVRRAQEFETQRQLTKIGKPVDRGEWGMTPPTVNAYYNAQMNDLNFPAGVLPPPLYDPKLDDAPNYGNTGSTIGHELTHAFDDEGRQFDGQGNLKDWWTPDDAKKFEERVQCVRDQYAQYTIVEDIKINSKLTSGEDVADLGGTLLAYIAWKDAVANQHLEPVDGFTPDQRFFIGFAQWACENERPENQRVNAITNPHSPGKYRVNGIVSNMPEFWKAFNCQAGNPMVRGAKACKVW